MLCGCTNSGEPRATSTADDLRQTYDDGRRLVVPSPTISSLRHCLSVRTRPSSANTGVARGPTSETVQSDELVLGEEARPRTRSYTLTDGATSAIGRILTCFQDTETNSDDLSRSRPRSRSLWSRRRTPTSCLQPNSSGNVGGCVVDVVLDCSPGTVRRRRLETQSVASTSSMLHSDAVWNPVKVSSQVSEASCELTATSSERVSDHSDHPVWERRQVYGIKRRQTEPTRQRPAVIQSHNAPAADIPPRQNWSLTQRDRSRHVSSSRTAGDSAPCRRRITRRATTCVIPRTRVLVAQSPASPGGQPVTTEHEYSVKPTTTCRVSYSLESHY